MNRHTDLEAAIAAEPDLPAPYLVYADWLQQRGDPRGDLIAVQHARELADAPELRLAERELFVAHLRTWLGPALAHHDHGEIELVWRRGFIAAARVRRCFRGPASDVAEILRALTPRPVARVLSHLTIEVASFGTTWDAIAADVVPALPAALVHLDHGRPADAPAFLEIVSIPAGFTVVDRTAGARIALHAPDQRFTIGRSMDSDLHCSGPGLGGRRNCELTNRGGVWTLDHMMHAQPILVNGESIASAVLCDGDLVEPAPGFVLLFSIPR